MPASAQHVVHTIHKLSVQSAATAYPEEVIAISTNATVAFEGLISYESLVIIPQPPSPRLILRDLRSVSGSCVCLLQ
jgi:hypothetical protein